MISGTDPRANAMTGVPHAMASIMIRPNGSGQSIGKSMPPTDQPPTARRDRSMDAGADGVAHRGALDQYLDAVAAAATMPARFARDDAVAAVMVIGPGVLSAVLPALLRAATAAVESATRRRLSR